MQSNKENVTLIVFALDKSGSMGSCSGLWPAAISGTNEFVQSQDPAINTTLPPGNTLFGMVLFDTTVKWKTDTSVFNTPNQDNDNTQAPYVFNSISKFVPLTDEAYKPYGMTAMYDAVAKLITGVDLYIIDHPEQNVNVICVIQTDGEENSSKRTSAKDLREMITTRTLSGWKFTFLGADQDACMSASLIGINRESAMCYSNDALQTRQVMNTMSNACVRNRTLPSDEQLQTQVAYTDAERHACMGPR